MKTGIRVRFNDLLQTVLSVRAENGPGAVTLWRQCVDLLAQYDRPGRPPLHPRDRALLLRRLAGLRKLVDERQRAATVKELGGRLRSPTLVRFFADDRPAVCAAAMTCAQLPDALWPGLLAKLGPTARGVLRSRRDLGPETRRALNSFGSNDLVLTNDMLLTSDMVIGAEDLGEEPALPVETRAAAMADAVPAKAPPVEEMPAEVVLADPAPVEILPLPAVLPADESAEDSPIRRLVDRIEQFTSASRDRNGGNGSAGDRARPRGFSFETDSEGTIIWVGDAPRATLVGLSIAEPALLGGSGPDGHVVGAFRRRSGFENARFTVEAGPLGGEWRVSAIPFFDQQSGRFQGYRGQARRPYLHEIPAMPEQDEGLSGDSLRQLVHELRTPLNAILGFAEIIEKQFFGPVSVQYRSMAEAIMADARQLLAAFDDLELATRLERGDDGAAPEPVDPAALIARIAGHFRADPSVGPERIDITVVKGLPPVCVDPVQGERMVQHLLRTLISVAPSGEPVTGSCWYQPDGGAGQVLIAMDKPSNLRGMDEAQLLDPGYGPDGDWPDAPLLGVGFSLRLVRSLAQGGGGDLDISTDRFVLALPAIASAAGESGVERG